MDKSVIHRLAIAVALLALPASSGAQLALPPLAGVGGGVVGGVVDRMGAIAGSGLAPVTGVVRSAASLAQERVERLAQFVAQNRAVVELDLDRAPARRGELLLLDPDPATISAAQGSGYTVIEQGQIDGLDVAFARLEVPKERSLAQGEKALRRLIPGKTISADPLHFASGSSDRASIVAGSGAGQSSVPLQRGGSVGVIDGGMPAGGAVAAQAGFATGAPKASGHAQAIRSLLLGAGVTRIYAADVYGTDPAGGSAFAIARALGWMAQNRVPVVSISLVGPANPLLERAVASAQARGMVVVAAVGNDGPAAPPAYPASYGGVIAVTGVDKNGRVLFEAGRAVHVDYAAPGADVSAIGLDGRRQRLRGTSFAAPLAASRIAANRSLGASAAAAIARTNAEAIANGARSGRGIVCGGCRAGL